MLLVKVGNPLWASLLQQFNLQHQTFICEPIHKSWDSKSQQESERRAKACPQSVTCFSNKSFRKWLWGAGRNQYHMCSLRNEKLELPTRWTLPSAHVWWNVSGVRAADSFRVFRILEERALSREVNHRLVVFFNALDHLHGDGKSVCCGQSIGVNVSLHTYTYSPQWDMLHRGNHRMSKLAHSRPTVGSCGWTVGLWLITDYTGQWVLVF